MKKRCIMNVAVGGNYPKFQQRLIKSLDAVGDESHRLFYTSVYPPGSPTHAEVPYGFKVHAFRAAQAAGYDSLLWLDTSVFAVRPLMPLWKRMEKHGNFFIVGGDKLGNWSSDEALMSFGITRDAAMAMQLMGGTVIGLDLRHERTQMFMSKWEQAMLAGLFNGHYVSDKADAATLKAKADKPQGKVSDDPRCMGHRHDETIGSLLAYQLEMPLTWIGGLMQGDTEQTVLRSNYELSSL